MSLLTTSLMKTFAYRDTRDGGEEFLFQFLFTVLYSWCNLNEKVSNEQISNIRFTWNMMSEIRKGYYLLEKSCID